MAGHVFCLGSPYSVVHFERDEHTVVLKFGDTSIDLPATLEPALATHPSCDTSRVESHHGVLCRTSGVRTETRK